MTQETVLEKQVTNFTIGREGWHNTERYGLVFLSPGGIAWTVRRQGDRLANVPVKLAPGDLIKKTATEKVKANAYLKRYRANLSKQANQPLQGVE